MKGTSTKTRVTWLIMQQKTWNVHKFFILSGLTYLQDAEYPIFVINKSKKGYRICNIMWGSVRNLTLFISPSAFFVSPIRTVLFPELHEAFVFDGPSDFLTEKCRVNLFSGTIFLFRHLAFRACLESVGVVKFWHAWRPRLEACLIMSLCWRRG